MKNIRDSIKLFRFNLLFTILFEVFLKAVSFGVLIPLYYAFINLAVKLAGIKYLTKETALKFFKAPSTYAFVVIMMIFAAMYIMINVSGLSYAYKRANYLKKTSPLRMFGYGLKTSFRLLRPRNLPFILFVLCYLPVIGNVILNFRLLNIRAPYVIDIISVNIYMTIAFVFIYIMLLFFSLKYVFLIHIFNVDKVSFRKSVDKDKEILHNNRLRVFFGVLFWCILCIAVPAVLNYIYTEPVLQGLLDFDAGIKFTMMLYEVLKIVLSFTYVILGLPLICAYLGNTYYNLIPEEEGPNIDNYEEYDSKKNGKRERKVFAIVIVVALVFDVGFYALKRYDIISINADYMSKVTITAHRGDNTSAPENTLSAFENAVESGADVIELDVRETKDGEIVVMHDESLRRTCGVNKKVGKLTYEQLLQYTPTKSYKGSNKSDFADEKIPTLREVLELVGDRAQLNIEIKSARTDKNLEKSVVELIQEYDYHDNCVVTSPTYGSIKKIKQMDPDIKTVYVMSVAMGDFYTLEYADAFSIKYRYINTELVKKAHEYHKEVYAWTVDSKEILESMMLLNVDSIITNNPKGMRRAMYENYYGDTLIERVNKMIENQL